MGMRAGTPAELTDGGLTSGVNTSCVNEVRLIGRLAAPAQVRALPSGDEVATWRLVVDRSPARRKPPEGVRLPTLDTLECSGWTAATRRSSGTWAPGDVLEVHGSLRRRFWRAGPGVSSRYEVEVERVRRIARAR